MNIMCNSRIYSPSLESLAVYNRDVVIKMTLMNYFLKTVFFDFLMSADKTNKQTNCALSLQLGFVFVYWDIPSTFTQAFYNPAFSCTELEDQPDARV